MLDDLINSIVDYNDHSDYDMTTIYDYEVFKPITIEKAIKEKRIQDIKDSLSIYCWDADRVMSDKSAAFGEDLVGAQIIEFLKLAVDTHDLRVLRAVWEYGARSFMDANRKSMPSFISFIADLVKQQDNFFALNYLAAQIPCDSFFIRLDSSYSSKSMSGEERQDIFGNLLAASILYGNETAIRLFCDKQPALDPCSLKDFLSLDTAASSKKYYNAIPILGSLDGVILKRQLCSLNPLDYALETGNIEMIEKLLDLGYSFDFKSDDFWCNLGNYGSRASIEYIKKHHKDSVKNCSLSDALLSANHLLLEETLTRNSVLDKGSLNLLFYHYPKYIFGCEKEFFDLKRKNIIRCLRTMAAKKITVEDVNIAILIAMRTVDYKMLDLVIKIYPKNMVLDLTDIIEIMPMNADMLRVLSESIELFFDADQIRHLASINLRYFQLMLKYMDFRLAKSAEVNELTKKVLDLERKTSIKTLYIHGFLNNLNYKNAISYIFQNKIENLIEPFIECFNNEGGIEKNYDL